MGEKMVAARIRRKRHFQSGTKERRWIMSARLSKELRKQYGVKTMPVCRGDDIIMMRGTNVDKEAKVTEVYRKKFIIKTDNITTKNAQGQDVPVPIQPSNVMITNLNMTDSRKKALERR